MNKVVLVGRLTRDPELRSIGNGSMVATFTLAIGRPFKNKEGVIETDFINISVFGRQAENLGKYCFKGSQVGIDGRIQTRSYDAQDGTKRYVTEVIADNVEFLSSKRDSDSQRSNNSYVDVPGQTPTDVVPTNDGVDVSSEDPFKDFGSEVVLSDDDLPF